MVIALSKLTFILVVVCFFIARLADCCNRTPARSAVAPPGKTPVTSAPPGPRSTSSPGSSGGGSPAATSTATDAVGTTSAPPRSHRLPCTGPEIQRTACLNKGTCFAVIIENTRQAFCRCPEKYSGPRCQDAQLPPGIFFSMENIQTANIATGATVAIIIVVVILLSLYVYVRWRNKTRQSQTTTATNNTGMTRASSRASINGVDAIRNPALTTSHRSSQYSISSHPALSKSKESLDPGGFFNAPPMNGASYYTMQDFHAPSWSPSPARTPERTSPWLHRHRSYSRASGRNLRHSQTDNVLSYDNRDSAAAFWPPYKRSASETTV